MSKYKCVIYSDSSFPREYEVDSMSAMKAANEFGRGEFGEVVEVRRKRTNQLLSRVAWEMGCGRSHYHRVYIGKRVRYD